MLSNGNEKRKNEMKGNVNKSVGEHSNKRKIIILTTVLILILLISALASLILFFGKQDNVKKNNMIYDPELARAMTYQRVGEQDKDTQSEYVKFDAFFLRDLDNDGIADGVRGTCKEIGTGDTLYMELNVLTNGELVDGKIEINSDNFYLQTAIPKDGEIKENAISDNTKKIILNNIKTGTQRLLTGIVRSGNYSYSSGKSDAIGNNINNYSKKNTIVLTGKHIDSEGNETPIRKEVSLDIDWYGKVGAEVCAYKGTKNYKNQEHDITKIVDEDNDEINLQFEVLTRETKKQLILSKSEVIVDIPQLNGYNPKKVTVQGKEQEYNYDEETRKLTITKLAEVDDKGRITKNAYTEIYNSYAYNNYSITVTYDLNAYKTLTGDTIEIKLPVTAYYEGYNNTNEEFVSPQTSNRAYDMLIATYRRPQGRMALFNVIVGKRKSNYEYFVSKDKPLKIYNSLLDDNKEDLYEVLWEGYTGTEGKSSGMTMTETKKGENQVVDRFVTTEEEISMEKVTTNVGIYFGSPEIMLGEDGWIRVYNEETDELVQEFTSKTWGKYSASNPYRYSTEIKHIRIETSKTNANSTLYVYNIKRLDDEVITSTYNKDEFDKIQYIKSTLTGYLEDRYINTDFHSAHYDAPYATANLTLSRTAFSTQETEKDIDINIYANGSENFNQSKWKNGIFLLKMPKDILELEINEVKSLNRNVTVKNYEKYIEDGINYLKITTENDKPESYQLKINCNLTADPRIETKIEEIEIYAYSEDVVMYEHSTADKYDINGNLNLKELIFKGDTSLSLLSPNSLLTSQTATNYDKKESTTIAPRIALIDKEQRTARINVNLKNNYNGTISDVKIVGRIPFEQNKYVINGGDMGSTFNTTMSNTGIILPEKYRDIANVYYSENPTATNDINLDENNWEKQPDSFENVKSYLIDFGNYQFIKEEECTPYYEINIPIGTEYNEVTYSHHAVYFSLDTTAGKYKTQTEPNKIGFMIAKQYDLDLKKYQKDKENTIPGATYFIHEKDKNDGQSIVTQQDGSLSIEGLYIGRTYVITEIKSPEEYELNEDVIEFRTTETDGTLSVEQLAGTTKNIQAIQPTDENGYKVSVEVEDEVKVNLKLTKKENNTETRIKNVKYKLTGEGLPSDGRLLITDQNGEVTLKGLKFGVDYTIEELKAEGYYLASPIKFNVVNNEGEYSINILEGDVAQKEITVKENIPTLNLEVKDEKIPRFTLDITKIKKVTKLESSEENEQTTEKLSGAKFELYKDGKKLGTYTSNTDGKIVIEDLYQTDETKGDEHVYILKEILTPDGYAKVKDIKFRGKKTESGLEFEEELTEGQAKKQYKVEGNTIYLTIEDNPTFKLIKKDADSKKELEGIKFAIYNVDNGEVPARNGKGNIVGKEEVINGKTYYTFTTDSNGEITADLPEGYYKAVELQAPNQYDISNSTYYFGIGVSREPEYVYQGEWGRTIAGHGNEYIGDLCVTQDGGCALVGKCRGSIDFLDGIYLERVGEQVGFVCKYAKDGKVEWAKLIDGKAWEFMTSVISTADGGIVVGGYIESVVELDDGTILTPEADQYNKDRYYNTAILVKYDIKGNLLWHKVFKESEDNSITASSISALEETQDGGFLVSVGGMLVKYSSTGELEWTKSISCRVIIETENRDIIIAGSFSGQLELDDSIQLNSNGNTDIFIIKYNSNRELQWVKQIGGDNYEIVGDITEIEDGKIAIGGEFKSEKLTLGDKITLTNKPNSYNKINYSGFLALCDSNGEFEWANTIASGTDDEITSITISEDKEIIISGNFDNSTKINDEIDLYGTYNWRRSRNNSI